VAEGDRFSRMGFIPWIGNWFLIAWGWDFGVNVWDAGANQIRLNAPEMVQALEWELTYAEKYGVTAIQNFQTGFGSGADDPLITGRVAMILTGNWVIAYLREYGPDFDYGIAPAPYPAGRSAMTWSGGFVVGIPQGSKKAAAAWEFVGWLAGPEAQGIYAERGEVLPTNIAAATAFAEKNAAQKQFIDLLPVSYIEPVIPEWSLAWDQHLVAEQEALFGQKTAQQALDDANAKVQAALDARLAGG
jgi:multiple sugar transport system substrate-binding protein